MSWTFEKVDIELLDNLVLNSHEKLLYILISRFKNCKNGVNVSKGKVKRPSKNPNIARGCGAVMSNRRKLTKFR